MNADAFVIPVLAQMLIIVGAFSVALGVIFYHLIDRRLKKMAVDLTAEFANLDAAIAALPARIAAAEANQIQPSDVQAAADARAATVNAILPAPPPTA